MIKRGGKRFPSKPPHRLIFLGNVRSRAAGHHAKPWETQKFDSGSLQVTRGSRNQGVIGGVVFYTRIINIRADVICSVVAE
jgi:hypothetical protein